jgi:predicted ATPase
MLMDLFFDAAPVPAHRKLRIHFHSFMLSIHQKMYDVSFQKMGGDTLPHIARSIVDNDCYLLCLDEFQVRPAQKRVDTFLSARLL